LWVRNLERGGTKKAESLTPGGTEVTEKDTEITFTAGNCVSPEVCGMRQLMQVEAGRV